MKSTPFPRFVIGIATLFVGGLVAIIFAATHNNKVSAIEKQKARGENIPSEELAQQFLRGVQPVGDSTFVKVQNIETDDYQKKMYLLQTVVVVFKQQHPDVEVTSWIPIFKSEPLITAGVLIEHRKKQP